MSSSVESFRDAALQYACSGVCAVPLATGGVGGDGCGGGAGAGASDSLADEAVRLARGGFTVLALGVGLKYSIKKGGYKNGSRDPEIIEAAWRECPAANVGLVTGRFIVIDVDLADSDWLTPERLRWLATATVVVRSPKGLHFYFLVPEGVVINCSASRLGPGVDVRGFRGHITAPPSVLEDGRSYSYERGVLTSPGDLAMLPEGLLAELLAIEDKRRPVEPGGEVGGIPQGRRNDSLFRTALALRRQGLGDEQVLAQLQRLNRDVCKPPLDDAEVRSIVASAMRRPLDTRTDAGQAAGVGVRREVDLIVAADVPVRLPQWLWNRRIERGALNLLVAPPGAGKTWLTCAIASLVSRGGLWPDLAPCERGSVIMFNAEDDPSSQLVPRLLAHSADLENIHFASAARTVDEKGTVSGYSIQLSDVDLIRGAIEATPDLRLLIVDPIGSFIGGRVNTDKDNEVRSALTGLLALARQHGLAVLLVAHTRKDSSGSPDDLVLGSRAFSGLARSVVHVVRDADDDERRLLLVLQ